MPIEKFSTIKPAPGQGKRVMKSKLLTALGATGVLRPFTANPEHILERKILLQNTFSPNPVGPPTPPPPAFPLITNGLFAYFESSDFDATPNNTTVGLWNDKITGLNTQAWQNGFGGDNPFVDQTRLANGHATLRFNGKACLGNSAANPGQGLYASGNAATYPNGVEFFVVFMADNDPPTGANLGNNGFGTPCTDNGMVLTLIEAPGTNFPDHTPFSDGNTYTGFGQNTRVNAGHTGVSTAGGKFHVLNVSSAASGTNYNAWIDDTLYLTSGAYTFNTNQGTNASFVPCQVGGFSKGSGGGGNFWGLVGNIAGVYCYNRTLTSTERTGQRGYINTKFGTNI